ncbi:MAG: GNAT family N-acetyltransferase [Actinobacteria bacterium]|nr:GNAT family N-acetyltransferase [Actinomycetota bacterium]
MPQIAVRPARLADVNSVAAVHHASAVVAFVDIFPPASVPPTAESLLPGWRILVEGLTSKVFVAEVDDVVVGVAAVAADSSLPAGLALSRLYVHPDRWGQRVGATLHDVAMGLARSLGAGAINLWVLEANIRARSMYESRGWALMPGHVLKNDPPEVVDVLYQFDLTTSGLAKHGVG